MDIQTKTDIIHQKIYDFLLYIYPLLTKYPKYEKFSLQTATRNAILEMLQEVIKWDKTATKSHLYTVDTALQESKELLRLAHEEKKYGCWLVATAKGRSLILEESRIHYR